MTPLIVIDMQDFFLKNFDLKTRTLLIKNQSAVINACVKDNTPIIIVEYKTRGIYRGETTSVLLSKIKNNTVTIIKESNSAFTNTALDEILKKMKAKKILLMGINANACVQDTAIAAIKRGYKVLIPEGTIASASRNDMTLSKKNKEWYLKNCIFI